MPTTVTAAGSCRGPRPPSAAQPAIDSDCSCSTGNRRQRLPPAPAPAPATEPAEPPPPPPAELTGTWKAAPSPDTAITLALKADGDFTWNVANKGQQNQSIHGRAVYVNDVLSLTQEEGPPLAGKIESKDASKFTFRLMGGGNNAPALTFTR